ncbi:MAG TPA: hypothetical protein VFU23_10000 [Gemmatimonadales bacterium]|nr:hypothetical protein [Gemmatimonadales bacterium]
MAAHIVKSLPKSGSVSRRKIRAAVRALGKYGAGKSAPAKKGKVRRIDTASGRGLIAFRKPGSRKFAA